MHDLDLIRERIDLHDLAEEAGAEFRNDSSRCPLHGGDNPTAFHVYENGRKWHCFTNCTEGENDGDVFAFYMRWKGVEFKEAVRELAARAAVDGSRPHPQPLSQGERGAAKAALPKVPGEEWRIRAERFVEWAHEQLLSEAGAQARAYLLAERGLDEHIWEVYRLGYCPMELYDRPERWGLNSGKKIWLPKGIVIPGIYEGQLWYVKVRRPVDERLADYLGAVETMTKAKFGGPRGGVLALFGAETWIGRPVLMLVEGEWDCMLTWKEAAGLCDVGTLGSGRSRADVVDLVALARYPAVLVVYDMDQAGDEARRYWKKVQESVPRIQIVTPPDHDLTDYRNHGGNLRRWIAEQVGGQMESLMAMLDKKHYPNAWEEWQAIKMAAEEWAVFGEE